MSHMEKLLYLVYIVLFFSIIYMYLDNDQNDQNDQNDIDNSIITDTYVKNPSSYYWINRVDGSGKHIYNNDPINSIYLTLLVKPYQTTACSDKIKCKELNSNCIDGACIPYSNAEIYNSTCCNTDSIQDMGIDTTVFNFPNKYRISLLKMVCENQPIVQHCNLNYTPTITLDDPITQTRQSILDTVINTPYLYSTVKQTITCKNLKDGSRGFGFWNTSADLQHTSIAWFIQIDSADTSGFYAHCQIPAITKNFISFVKLPDLDENEHTYTVDWKKDRIQFSIDGKIVHIETTVIPTDNMAYHNWVDNSVFTYENGSLKHLIQKLKTEKSNQIKSIEIEL